MGNGKESAHVCGRKDLFAGAAVVCWLTAGTWCKVSGARQQFAGRQQRGGSRQLSQQAATQGGASRQLSQDALLRHKAHLAIGHLHVCK